jgi:hypothetical protein
MPTIMELRWRLPHEEPSPGSGAALLAAVAATSASADSRWVHLAVNCRPKGMALINCASPTAGTLLTSAKEDESTE